MNSGISAVGFRNTVRADIVSVLCHFFHYSELELPRCDLCQHALFDLTRSSTRLQPSDPLRLSFGSARRWDVNSSDAG